MSQPFDSCRLYRALRNKAWSYPGGMPSSPDCGTIDLDREFAGPRPFGLSREQARIALASLMETHLVHRVTRPDQPADREPAEDHRLFVEPIDDLTATTLLMSQ